MIYPGPRSSIRFERLREGIQDYEKIRILRQFVNDKSNDQNVKDAAQELELSLAKIDFSAVQTEPASRQVNTVKASILKLSRVLGQN